MLFCCFVSVNVFAQGKEHNEITIAILKGDNLSEYKDLLSKTIKEKLNKTVKIKVLDYDTFIVDMDRGNSNFYKGSPLTYVFSLSNNVILKSVYKINNHKKHREKGTYYKIKSYLCTRKHVCRDSAITAFLVSKPRQYSSRHPQGAVNKHVAFSNHYMLLVFSAGIDCLFHKTPHYLLR